MKKLNQNKYLVIISAMLAVYYVVLGFYMHRLGYVSNEALFYTEKTKIVLGGMGDRLKVMGLTAPLLPFSMSFIFWPVGHLMAPLIASAVCTAALFYFIGSTLIERFKNAYYLFILLDLFLFHPGLLYAGCSGKSIALVLVFFLLFFFNLIKFYQSNTTFHVSVASIFLVLLIFCDYKFIWLCLFFIPLVLSITIQSLNLGEQESIFRLFISFNNPSLRRKLINKTFALYIILFILPIACITCYKLLNLTHAQDLNYFNESPYATWTVLADKLSFDALSTGTAYALPEVSVLISLKVLLFCPLMLVAIYLFRHSTYQILTLITPFAFVEFLHIKYEKVFLTQEYYLMFLVLALLCVFYKTRTVKNQALVRIIVGVLAIGQIYTGYFFLKNSSIPEERDFVTTFQAGGKTEKPNDDRDLADYINKLPDNTHILMDDAITYPVVAYTKDIHKLTLPYQNVFLSAIEAPDKYDGYILLATDNNQVNGFTQLNNKYLPIIKNTNSGLRFRRVYETDNWILYKIF
jgi:hypothetical protein